MKQLTFKKIKSEVEYETIRLRLEIIFDAEKGTPEGDELDMLTFMIAEYESEHFPISKPKRFSKNVKNCRA